VAGQVIQIARVEVTAMRRNGELGSRFHRVLVGAFLAITAAVSSAAPAQAQLQSTYPAEVENQCRDDYFRYCSPYALGSDELRRCMEAKGRSLSSHCQKALKDAGYVRPNYRRRGG
jgi:hypothetical protein